MRIITGSARGRKLKTLDGLDVRPTTDKVKEAIYSAIQFEIEGSTVLDLFSGSGQMGIEALSRGANLVFFVDKSKASIDCTRENLETVGFSKQAKIFNMDSLDFIATTSQKFDIVILDPPYSKDIIQQVLPMLQDRLNYGAKVVCEHEKHLNLPENVGDLILKKKYSYGKTQVTLYTYGLEEIL
ncbi:MAG: 16S rRNA (guanine(966)-N(2))-methyltransferase RsmD [Ruminococcus sp.]|nr:16S rRNA (guanine(966)-N(2))-methyltransferase RsmD [Ruminococcus sp.]MCD7801010.1 16S rRNA (guanine(966)-N(2))-methyltransferase RsmD [Ruminococcus sp.]